MDEQNRESDIRQHIRERLTDIELTDSRRINTANAVEKLNDTLPTFSRRKKREARQRLEQDNLSRRNFLKLLGLTGVGAIAAGGVIPYLRREFDTLPLTGYAASDNVSFDGNVDVSSQGSYEVWNPSGHRVATVKPGSTVENVLIKQDASNSLRIDAKGDGWTVRNIGWDGTTTSKWEGGGHVFQLRTQAPSGGSGTVENIFVEGWGSSMGGMWNYASHAGTVNVKNSYFAGFGNNSCYLSGQGKNGNSNGNVIIDSCFSDSSTTGNFRVSGQGSRVRNCVVVHDDPNCRRGHYPNQSDAYTSRPIAARHWNDIVAENCSVYVDPDHCDPARRGHYQAWACGGCSSNGPETVLTIKDCRLNDDAPNKPAGGILGGRVEGSPSGSPTMSVLKNGGVPTTPEEAANGERGTPDTSMDGKASGESTSSVTEPGESTSSPC